MRWWRLPIKERACRETDLGGGDYYLRNSGLPPSPEKGAKTFSPLRSGLYTPIISPVKSRLLSEGKLV